MTINLTALMQVRELLGWHHKAIDFTTGDTLAQFLKEVMTTTGQSLHDLFVQDDGSISSQYMVWLNCRPVKQAHSLEIPLQSGDRIIAMPAMATRVGG